MNRLQIPLRFASGIIPLALRTSSRLIGTRSQRVSLKGKGGLVRASLKHEEKVYTFLVILLSANYARYC